jgi:hypothetical protein
MARGSRTAHILFLLDYLYSLGIQTSPAEIGIDEAFKSWFSLSVLAGRLQRVGL